MTALVNSPFILLLSAGRLGTGQPSSAGVIVWDGVVAACIAVVVRVCFDDVWSVERNADWVRKLVLIWVDFSVARVIDGVV